MTPFGRAGAFSVDGLLDGDTCAVWIARAEAAGFAENAPIHGPGGFVQRPDVRNNARVILDLPEEAAALWALARPLFPALPGVEPVGLNERFRIYRYGPGQRFAPHTDGFFERPDGSARSLWTLIVYLNGDCEGGETRILGEDVRPVTGRAVAFPHHLYHEGREVRAGRKYALRTDVMCRLG